jgi:hypothetical protein
MEPKSPHLILDDLLVDIILKEGIAVEINAPFMIKDLMDEAYADNRKKKINLTNLIILKDLAPVSA